MKDYLLGHTDCNLIITSPGLEYEPGMILNRGLRLNRIVKQMKDYLLGHTDCNLIITSPGLEYIGIW